MKRLIHRAFGIYPGEGKNAMRFIRLAVLWCFGSSIVETLSTGLFLEKIGPQQLPITYLLSALVLITISCLFIYCLRITSPHNIFYKTLYFCGILFAFFTIVLFAHPPPWFWFLLKISGFVVMEILTASYWTFLPQYHDIQDAKRIYGIYNAAYFLGYVFSGFCISLLIGIIKEKGLFILAFIAIAISLIETYLIKKNVPPMEDDTTEALFSSEKRGFLSIFRLFYKSRFAISLVFMSLIIQIIRTTTEFSYMSSIGTIFKPATNAVSSAIAENSISAFIGTCKAYISAFNIIFGMFFYSRFVRRFTLGNMILIPPLFFLALYSNWTITNSLLIVISAVICVEFIFYTVEDNNFNLLINAAPYKLQGMLRIINDSFFEPVGMLLTSLFLVFMQSYNIWFGLSLTFVFVALSLIVKYLYPKSILKNLKENAVHFEIKFTDWLNHLNKKEQKEIQQDIIETLNSNSETTQLLAFEALLLTKNKKRLPLLLSCINSFSVESKIKALNLLDKSFFDTSSDVIKMINNFLQNKSFVKNNKYEELIKKSKFYLAKRGLLRSEEVIHFLNSEDLFLKAIAILTLRYSKEKEKAYKELFSLLKSSDESKICMGLSILGEEKSISSAIKILKFFNSTSIAIQREATKSLSKIVDKTFSQFSLKIIEQLKKSSDSKTRIYCLEALKKIEDISTIKELILTTKLFRPNELHIVETIIKKMKVQATPILTSIIKNIKLADSFRILAAKILGKISIKQIKVVLNNIIDTELKRAYLYFFAAHDIQKQYPNYDLSLLKDALFTGFQSAVDFIIHLLGATGEIENCDIVIHSLHSKNEKTHSNAIELLEQRCDFKILKKIIPLIDDVPWETKINAYLSLNKQKSLSKISLSSLLNILENSASLFDRAIVINLKAKLKLPEWKDHLKAKIKTKDEPLHQYAYELLKT